MKSHQITRESFDRFLKWLDPDETIAAQKYESIRFRLIKLFDYRGLSDPEELADRTIDRVMSKITDLSENYEGEPVYYFLGVANKIAFEQRRIPKIEQLPHNIPAFESEINEPNAEYHCLEKCLKSLREPDRELVVNYYADERNIKHREELAEQLGINWGNLRVRMFRLKSQLQKCIKKCLKEKL